MGLVREKRKRDMVGVRRVWERRVAVLVVELVFDAERAERSVTR